MATIIKRYGTVTTVQPWGGFIDKEKTKPWEKLLLCFQYYDEKNTRFGKKSSVILQVNENDLSKMLGNRSISVLLQKTWEASSIQEYTNKDGFDKQVPKKYETLLTLYEADK